MRRRYQPKSYGPGIQKTTIGIIIAFVATCLTIVHYAESKDADFRQDAYVLKLNTISNLIVFEDVEEINRSGDTLCVAQKRKSEQTCYGPGEWNSIRPLIQIEENIPNQL